MSENSFMTAAYDASRHAKDSAAVLEFLVWLYRHAAVTKEPTADELAQRPCYPQEYGRHLLRLLAERHLETAR